MSFKFSWPIFDDNFYSNATDHLERALNNGPKPQHICDSILVIEMNMGSIAPNLEMLEITNLSLDRFRGIFRLSYNGDAYVILQTKVQVNPVTSSQTANPRSTFISSPFQGEILSAHKPLVVPLQLKICSLVLDAIFSLSVSAKNGITLAFKNDPIQSVLIHSTFDDTQSVRDMLQHDIEKQLRDVFVDVVPRVLHDFSMKYASGEDKDVEELLKNPKSRRSSLHDLKESFDSGIGHSISDFRSINHEIAQYSSHLSTVSAPVSPIKPSLYFSSSSSMANPYHQSLSMHLYPYRNPLAARSELNFPSATVSNRADFDTLSLPKPAFSSSALGYSQKQNQNRTLQINTNPESPVKIRRSNPIIMSPSVSSAKRQNRLSTSPPISPIVGLHPANLRSSFDLRSGTDAIHKFEMLKSRK